MNDGLYEKLGGAEGLKDVVHRFYRIMGELPETLRIRQMHPADISISEEKLYSFLSGWTGGPSLYIEKYGHPMLRRRHFPFVIGEAERDQWLLCLSRALEETNLPRETQNEFLEEILPLAHHMINREPA